MSDQDRKVALIVSALQGAANIFKSVVLFTIKVITQSLIALGVLGIVIIIAMAVWYTGETTGLWDFIELEIRRRAAVA